jgi:hypothetical protein
VVFSKRQIYFVFEGSNRAFRWLRYLLKATNESAEVETTSKDTREDDIVEALEELCSELLGLGSNVVVKVEDARVAGRWKGKS